MYENIYCHSSKGWNSKNKFSTIKKLINRFQKNYINPYNRRWQSGLTIVEILLVMGVFAILSGIVTINLLNAKQSASINTAVNTLITDLKQQQLRAMIGDTGGRVGIDNYGIYFGSTTYTLFHGTAPNGDSSDLSNTLGEGLQFATGTNTFTGSKIVFLKGTGEVSGYDSTHNQIIVKNTTNNQTKTLTVNRYGVITSIN